MFLGFSGLSLTQEPGENMSLTNLVFCSKRAGRCWCYRTWRWT